MAEEERIGDDGAAMMPMSPDYLNLITEVCAYHCTQMVELGASLGQFMALMERQTASLDRLTVALDAHTKALEGFRAEGDEWKSS